MLKREDIFSTYFAKIGLFKDIKVLSDKVNQITETVATVQTRSVNNMAEIAELKLENKNVKIRNENLNNWLLEAKLFTLTKQKKYSINISTCGHGMVKYL